MTTPLQQFIDIQEKVHTDQLKHGMKDMAFATRQSIIQARELLGEEQKHLIYAHSRGIRFMAHDTQIPQPVSIDYYNQTYIKKPNTMIHYQLKSSMLNSAAFEDGVLEVEFSTGRRFKYQATQELYDELIRSDSPGKFFHAKIKGLPPVTYGASPKPVENDGEVDI